MRDVFVSWARDALDLVFPLECLACGRAGAFCCAGCLATVRPAERRVADWPLEGSIAAYAYAAPIVRSALTGWKYEGWTSAETVLEALVRRWAVSRGAWIGQAALVPVPLHPARERERGFNQAERIARWLAAATDAGTSADALVRVRATGPQARRGDAERTRNVAGAFAARLPRAWRGRPLLLVDDVMTTGATLTACAEALRAAGSGPVRAFALAWGGHVKDASHPTWRGDAEKERRPE